MANRGVLFVLTPVLACRPDAPPDSHVDLGPRTVVPDRGNPPPPVVQIQAGRGVIVRPGATVWFDAKRTRPFVLPDQLPARGIAMRVIADHGESLELEVYTQASCGSVVLDNLALRLFVSRDGLRRATSTELEYETGDGSHVKVWAGVPVEGAPGKYFVATRENDEDVPIPDRNVALDFGVDGSSTCMTIGHGDEAFEVGIGGSDLRHLSLRPNYFVESDAPVYWDDGTRAGKVVHKQNFEGPPTPAGTRTCFPLPLGEQEALTLCFDNADVHDRERELASKPIALVRLREPKVQGKIDKEIIRRIVRSHINEISHCCNLVVAENPAARGEFTARFRIGANGSVVAAEMKSNSVKSDKLAPCVVKSLTRWKFPRPTNRREVTVTFPFSLEIIPPRGGP